jgi:hypothetical protein
MFKSSFLMAAFALCAAALVVKAADDGHSRVPVLLELFTSEGCSSCPPADRLLEILDEKQPVSGALLIVLSEHVDYWDRLGWKDPFSSAQYTERQQEYTSRYRFDGVYTPQLVVDGRYGFVGSDGREASTAIQKAIRDPKVPMTISNLARKGNEVTARVELSADRNFKSARAMLYVALADNRQESHVARGENGGRTLAHVAVARIIRQAGMIDLDAASTKEIVLPVQGGSGSGLRLVAFIQDTKTGHVVAVAQQKL